MYDTNRFIHAAEPCAYHEEFAEDILQNIAAIKATCIAYHGVNNITVKFEDGFVLYHARWNQFVRGALHHNQKNINE